MQVRAGASRGLAVAAAVLGIGWRLDNALMLELLCGQLPIALAQGRGRGLKRVAQDQHTAGTKGRIEAVKEDGLGRWRHVVHGDGRDDGIKGARKGDVTDVALVQLHACADSGQFGAGACQHLGGNVVSDHRTLRETVKQFLRQVPRPGAQFQNTYDLLEEIQKKGLIALEWEESRGNYKVRRKSD